MSTAILALDLATSTGWALLDRNGVVTSGVQRFDLRTGESAGMRFLRCRRWLAELLEGGPPIRVGGEPLDARAHPVATALKKVDVIAYERGSHIRGGAAAQVLLGLQAVALEEAARLAIETLPANTATVKKHATGKGNAKKPDMITAAYRRWIQASGPTRELGDDEADALCVLAWAMDEVGAAATAVRRP